MGTMAYNLSRQGFGVTGATTGAEALRLARKLRPDLILLDLMLPGESGIEVCERIRERDQGVVIVMVTAKDAEDDKARGLDRKSTPLNFSHANTSHAVFCLKKKMTATYTSLS